MRWRGRRQSSNIQDIRGQGGVFRTGFPGGGGRIRVGRAGGGGIGMIIVLLIVSFIFGINPLELLNGGGGTIQTPQEQSIPNGQPRQSAQADDETRDFVATVLADTEDTWRQIFQRLGATYEEPTLVLFSGGVNSACGNASAASGPFYCPADKRLYIDLSFFSELRERFQAPGDFAQAYVIAHEVGHHVQNLIGVLPETARRRGQLSEVEANQMSIRVELQADCLAGVWANHTNQRGLLEQGDVDEALNAASQVGDDMIQRRTQGYVVPESFNHGTAEQRRTWFGRGFESGNIDSCDTFGPAEI
jgi:predicted metalloprotease